MPAFTATTLRNELAAYGIAEKCLTLLSTSPSPETVDYLDLLPETPKVHEKKPEKLLPDGVAEFQDRPLLYVLDHARLAVDDEERKKEIRQLRRILGCRGERGYLAIVEPGQLKVLPIAISRDAPPPGVLYRAGTDEAKTLFSRLGLALTKIDGEPDHPNYLFDQLFRLLTHAADKLAGQGIDKADVLSLIGRALFLRFLRDRKIVTERYASQIAPHARGLMRCFQTAENAADTCKWLDATFNGDFLPLSDNGSIGFFKKAARNTKDEVFLHLTAVLRNDEPAGSSYQRTLDLEWEDFDFAHVPVGLLSQVYEAFSWKWDPHAKATSIHYTPRRIASYVVDEAFEGLPKADAARVLDPACGAGVFLVLAFRKLYQAKWKANKVRPDTKEIRQILEKQITGFDVSESALRLAALSLYLTAIELDPEPVPPSKLRFKALRDRVLFNWRRDGVDPPDGPVLGSLGEHVGIEHNGAYQIVLCNPPWTSLPKGSEKDEEQTRLKQLDICFSNISRNVMERRGLPELAKSYRNPDRVPDLPFVWRSLEWCQKNGRIGFVLPGRILFKQKATSSFAREALFRSVAVTGIINCSNLTDTNVWPKMQQPFMLLFAHNRLPKPNHSLRFVTPHCDVDLNRCGEIRIDSKSIEPVAVEATFNNEEPWIWKSLAIGTSLDIDILRKINTGSGIPLVQYWENKAKLVSGDGYEIRENLTQKDATHLSELPDLNSTDIFSFVVDTKKLKEFSRKTAHRPRGRELYRQPLVLVKQSPKLDRSKGLALLCFEDVAFNESFYGFSAHGVSCGKQLVRYLHLFFHCSLWRHYSLLTSPQMGVERRKIHKNDLDEFRIIPWEQVPDKHRTQVDILSHRLLKKNDEGVFDDIDMLFADLYGLTKRDVEVIRDTLAVAMPFKKAREIACAPPTSGQLKQFRDRVESSLKPFFRKLDKNVLIKPWQQDSLSSPYSVLLLETAKNRIHIPLDLFEKDILPLANQTGASRIFFEVEGGLVIAILNQWRYWTPSRARLCAAEILRHHMTKYEG